MATPVGIACAEDPAGSEADEEAQAMHAESVRWNETQRIHSNCLIY